MQDFRTFIQQPLSGLKAIAHLSEVSRPFRTVVHSGVPVTILIGPEGDFAVEELALAHKMDWQFVTLGPYRLRTETAGLVACAQFNFINENQPFA